MKREGRKKTEKPKTRQKAMKRYLFAFALILVSVCVSYANSLSGTWALDDVVTMKPVGINDLQDIAGFRKIAYVTFLVNQKLAPFSPAYFRAVNLMIHIANTFLVFVLAFKTVILLYRRNDRRDPEKTGRSEALRVSPESEDRAFAVALISSVVFGLHPININAVAYIVQRMTSLVTFFVLLSLLSYIAATESRTRAGSFPLFLSSAGLLLLGIFSKENAVVAVPLFLLYDYVFLSRGDRKTFARRTLVIAGLGVAGIGIASYFLRFHETLFDLARFVAHPHTPLEPKGWTAVDVYWTPAEHVLTSFRVLVRYLVLTVLPLPQFLIFDYWGFPLSKGIAHPMTTLFSLVFVSAAAFFSVATIRRFPLLSFGILWYLCAISLESFFAVGADLYFEHRNYLPLVGLLIGIVGQVMVSLKGTITAKTIWMTAFGLACLFGTLTFTRNFVWKDSVTLWEDTLRKNPANLRAMMSLGNAYLKMSDFDHAEQYYMSVLARSSTERRVQFFTDSAYTLGMVYLFEGRLDRARELIDKFEAGVESYRPQILRGFYKALSSDVDGAIKDYAEVLGKTGGLDTVVVLTLTGDAYRKKGLHDQAIEHYRRARSLDPGFAAAYYGAGVSFMAKRDVRQAEEYFEKTLSIDPGNVLALSDMADLMLVTKRSPAEAHVFAERAVSLSPPFYQPYATMGNVLIILGRDQEAETYYQQAIERGMNEAMLLFNKARAYYMKGDTQKMYFYLAELRKRKDVPPELEQIINKLR